MKNYTIFLYFFFTISYSQNLSLNHDYIYDFLRYEQINEGEHKSTSFSIRPISLKNFINSKYLTNHFENIYSNSKNSIEFKILPIQYNTEFNLNHPYNRNNGNMLPNRGFQHIFSLGIYSKIGPLEIQFSPEHHYGQNKNYEGFWVGHEDIIWQRKYELWNFIDIPERFGEKRQNRELIGQSYISLNYKSLSIGVSNENLWWGPSKRNSIMMSNHPSGFKHLFIKSNKAFKTFFGDIEFQIISARLEASKYTPPSPEREYAGTKLYVPKINQNGRVDDWRYFQGGILSFSPKWIKGLNFGFIRWAQMYRGLVEGDYWWMPGKPTYFPLFSNLFRKNDSIVEYEEQTDQAAGIFFRWLWAKSKFEIYGEFHRNDAIYNLRDFLVDSDHTRGLTLGLSKVINKQNNDLLISWEWTQLEQPAGNFVRRGGSWYEHSRVFHGYTNFGEVIGAGIGPGSNSQYLSIEKIKGFEKYKFAFEIIDHNNDFYVVAFQDSSDFRRYWKDFNFHLGFDKKFRNIWLSGNLLYSRSLNYQWELNDNPKTYYIAGKDKNNFHASFKLMYFIPF